MHASHAQQFASSSLRSRYLKIRSTTLELTQPFSAEDLMLQSMPDASPAKWHLAHTTWFFESFLLVPHLSGYRIFDEHFNFLFNSYYETVGARHPRPDPERRRVEVEPEVPAHLHRGVVAEELGGEPLRALSTEPAEQRLGSLGKIARHIGRVLALRLNPN